MTRRVLEGRLALSFLLCWLIAALLTGGCDGKVKGPYDKRADPFAVRDVALAEARSSDRPLLIIFGANWCPDCRALDEEMSRAPLSELVEGEFIKMYVHIGNWDRNMAFVAEYGDPVANGIPSVVLVDADNRVLAATSAGELASARARSADDLQQFFHGLANLADR